MIINCVSAFVLDNALNKCIIESNDSLQQSKLYYSKNINSFEKEDYIGTYDGNEFNFPRIFSDKRVYYHLELSDNSIIHFGERILKIPGMYNLRDMGGYPTKDGRHVKWGILYRSDQLFNAEENSVEYLESLNIKTIVDLRSKTEIEIHPNIELKSVKQQLNFDPNAHIAAFAGSLQNNELDNKNDMIERAKNELAKNPMAADMHMINQQESFVTTQEAQKAFKEALSLLKDKNNAPILHHCKGGKDRTGFMSMMELVILGVDEEYIMKDYMLTREARKDKNKRYYNNFLKMTQNEQYAQFYYSLFDTKESYLQAAIDKINSLYPTLLGYAKEVYNLTDKDIDTIRSIYLES